jgi:hypothetical protein
MVLTLAFSLFASSGWDRDEIFAALPVPLKNTSWDNGDSFFDNGDRKNPLD